MLAVLPEGDDVPAEHDIQAAPPLEYVPAPHCVQAELAVLPAGDDEPAEHEAQTLGSVNVFDVAPGRAYLPAGQDRVIHDEPIVE